MGWVRPDGGRHDHAGGAYLTGSFFSLSREAADLIRPESMKKFQSLIVTAVVLAFCVAAFGAERATIGTAEMKADGTIVLRLRAELPGGGSGEGELVYPPTHPEYKKILEHVSPIAPGQTVPVRPWPTP